MKKNHPTTRSTGTNQVADKQLSSSKSSSSNHILSISQMRHKNQISVVTDVVTVMAGSVHIRRVYVGDCLAVVYSSQLSDSSFDRQGALETYLDLRRARPYQSMPRS